MLLRNEARKGKIITLWWRNLANTALGQTVRVLSDATCENQVLPDNNVIPLGVDTIYLCDIF